MASDPDTASLREGYRQLVGEQALTLEDRMQAAGARIVMSAGPNGWFVELTLARPEISVVGQAPMLSTALYLAASKAGLTDDLVPPPRGT